MKNIKFMYSKLTFLLASVFIINISCERNLSDDVEFAKLPSNGEVYIDGFSGGLEYLPFAGSVFNAFDVDSENKYKGTSSMRIDVPNVGDPSGAYAGAIFPDYSGRDLSGFDALTFWAKASQAATINEIGFGNDFGNMVGDMCGNFVETCPKQFPKTCLGMWLGISLETVLEVFLLFLERVLL